MSSDLQLLNAHFRLLESRWRVVEAEHDYASLVVPTGNSSEPIHRWFRFKEAYSHALFGRLAKDAGWQSPAEFLVVDPFAGSGTTLLSALEYGRTVGARVSALGLECSPVMHLIARAKVVAAAEPRSALEAIESNIDTFWAAYEWCLGAGDLETESPTLNNSAYFETGTVASLLALGRALQLIDEGSARDLLSVCVAASVEASGRIRKDGRALRFVREKTPVPPVDAFRASLARMRVDLAGYAPPDVGRVELELGDARRGIDTQFAAKASWAIFSPPYPNNIDYTEVYKVEAWVLGMFSSALDMRAQRLSTLRSHPSVVFPDQYLYMHGQYAGVVDELIGPLLAAVPSDRYTRGRRQLIRGYVDDMLAVLRSIRPLIADGAHAAIVVGNSVHGQGSQAFVVAADLLIARLAELAGFAVDEIRIARRPARRPDAHGWLRESVIALTAKA